MIVAICATIAAVLASAAPGDAIALTGTCPTITIAGKYAPAITIDASAATVAGVIITGAGVHWSGGAITAGPLGYGFSLRAASDVSIERVTFRNAARGVTINMSDHVLVRGNRLLEMTIDGIDIANSHFITIDRNLCVSFSTGLAHPDCVQGWTRAGFSMSDVAVTGNVAIGGLQGIYFGNLLAPGIRLPDPGFDRVTIADNFVRNLYPQGIGLYDCRDCTVTGNNAQSLPGAPFRTQVLVMRSTGKICGNAAPDLTGTPPALLPCPVAP
jgi:hypothetical protein